MLLFFLFQLAEWHSRGVTLRDKAELTLIFSQAIEDGTIHDPPIPPSAFMVRPQHGSYTILFTNAARERTGYFVSKSFANKDGWKFKELSDTPHVFTRDRRTNK